VSDIAEVSEARLIWWKTDRYYSASTTPNHSLTSSQESFDCLLNASGEMRVEGSGGVVTEPDGWLLRRRLRAIRWDRSLGVKKLRVTSSREEGVSKRSGRVRRRSEATRRDETRRDK